jgi:hypothetical protein
VYRIREDEAEPKGHRLIIGFGSIRTSLRGTPSRGGTDCGASRRFAAGRLEKPIARLLAAKKLKTKGRRSGTNYFVR